MGDKDPLLIRSEENNLIGPGLLIMGQIFGFQSIIDPISMWIGEDESDQVRNGSDQNMG